MELGPFGNRYVFALSSLDYDHIVSRVDECLENDYVMSFEEASHFITHYFGLSMGNSMYATVSRSEHSDGYDIRVCADYGNRYFSTYLPAAQMTKANIRWQLRTAEFQLNSYESPVISTASNPQNYEYGTWYREGADMVVRTQRAVHLMSREYLPRGFDYANVVPIRSDGVVGYVVPIRSDGVVSGRHQYRVRVVGWSTRGALAKAPMPKYKNKKRGLAGGLP